ncbi:MAG: PEP-CTERM sorting domain-containing protein [Pirellulaceae bacterium]
MLLLRFSAAIFFLVCFSFTSFVFADTVADDTDSQVDADQVAKIDFVDGIESGSLEEDAATISVPEPTTFGLITLGLAVAGGLLVRNRNDNF